MSPSLVLVGCGGHARVVLAMMKRLGLAPAGVVDSGHRSPDARRLGLPLLGDDGWLLGMGAGFAELANGIGGASLPALRRDVYRRFTAAGFRFPPLVHPAAHLDDDAVVGPGAQVMAAAAVQPGTLVGENAIINTGAVVDHDCRIGAHSHVGPGCALSGAVEVGEATLIGVGTSVRQGIRIGSGCVVGAGSVVVSDIPDGVTAFGCPAKVVKS